MPAFKVAMDIMHEELLYAEYANSKLQQTLEATEAELASCKETLAESVRFICNPFSFLEM